MAFIDSCMDSLYSCKYWSQALDVFVKLEWNSFKYSSSLSWNGLDISSSPSFSALNYGKDEMITQNDKAIKNIRDIKMKYRLQCKFFQCSKCSFQIQFTWVNVYFLDLFNQPSDKSFVYHDQQLFIACIGQFLERFGNSMKFGYERCPLQCSLANFYPYLDPCWSSIFLIHRHSLINRVLNRV